ncbi:hypothetical protein T492DRAFT_973339 [Pavlovales sp. CCMP2436]|nr:hypothetical protein T492DRAFT_973339 [Pavlovales sp. CCMP2436]
MGKDERLFTQRAGKGLSHTLAHTSAWSNREMDEENYRARLVFNALDLNAHHMHQALRALHGVEEARPPARRPVTVASSSFSAQTRSAGAKAAQGRASRSEAGPPPSWASRGQLIPEEIAPSSAFPGAPPFRTLVRQQTGPRKPPPLQVVTHKARPTIANMAVCKPARVEANITAVNNTRRR